MGCQRMTSPRFQRPYLAWLLMLAVLLRALIPAGYMPNTAQNSQGPAITMCMVGLSGPTIVYLDLDPQGSHHPHTDHRLLDCHLGSLLNLIGLDANTPTLALGLVILPLLQRLAYPSAPRRSGFLGAPLGARGPPAFS